MATQIFHTTDPTANERAAHAVWLQDQTRTVMYDGAERYAVGYRGELEEDIDRFAQFIAVCSASMLAEMQCIFSLWQSASPAKTYASSRPARVHGHQ